MQENQCDNQHSHEVEETTVEAENDDERSSLIGQ